jgi:Cap4 SAVED domain
MMKLDEYVVKEYALTVSSTGLTAAREGRRAHLKNDSGDRPLSHHLAGQLPYFYREPEKLAKEFAEEMAARRNALDLLYDLTVKMPTTPKFQQSHCGEILSALFLEEVLGLRRLMCKLTLTTSENTNVHKMDGFFVDTSSEPFTFDAVEAKSSILPTERTPATGHRHGILRQLIDSLENYGAVDERFDFTTVRDNLEAAFTAAEAKTIRSALFPPGPQNLLRLGMAVINDCTVDSKDDDFILTEGCPLPFNFQAVTVTNLADLAQTAYDAVFKLKGK